MPPARTPTSRGTSPVGGGQSRDRPSVPLLKSRRRNPQSRTSSGSGPRAPSIATRPRGPSRHRVVDVSSLKPRHADVLLVTGAITTHGNALNAACEAMSEPPARRRAGELTAAFDARPQANDLRRARSSPHVAEPLAPG